MHPRRMGILSDEGKKERDEGHHDTVNNASRRKSDTETVPNDFFHSAGYTRTATRRL